MGKGGSSTTTAPQIPDEIRALYERSGQGIQAQQEINPLGQFNAPGGAQGAYQTADRAPQFQQAQLQAQNANAVARQPIASRAALGNQPLGTQYGQQTAQQAAGLAGDVSAQFGNLQNIAQRGVGQQGLEQQAVNTASGIQDVVSQAPSTYGDVRNQADPQLANLIAYGDQQVTGQGIQQDPAYQQAVAAFQSTILPQIQNSAATSGLGRSTGLQQSIAAGEAQYLLPVIQDTLARQERGIDRGLGTRQFGIQTAADLGLQQAQAKERGLERYGQAGQFAAGLESDIGARTGARAENQIGREMDATLQAALAGERGTERQQQALQFLAGQQQAAGAQDLQRNLEGLYADERTRGLQYQAGQDLTNNLTQFSQLQQDYSQGQQDRNTQDYLRRQALAEQSLYAPFGQAPSAFGSQATSSGKKGK